MHLLVLSNGDAPSSANAAQLLASFGPVHFRTQDPVVVCLILPPRGFVTRSFCAFARYIHLHQDFVRRVIGERHQDREAEMKHKTVMVC
jgi:hypothetical protein